jgi:RND family efflux transporter MFP subunit
MMKLKKRLLPIVILIGTIFLVNFIVNNPPEVQRGDTAKASKLTVEVMDIRPETFKVNIDSYGKVRPRTQIVLTAQVSGKIVEINEQFRDGGFFEKGDNLVKLDDRDYLVQVKSAQATLQSAKQALAEENARGKQALIDWKRLGDGEPASDLVLRKPQLSAANALVLSAQAQLEKAQLDLERTNIVAPFAGRVLSKSVDIGQVVSINTEIAEIYAIDKVEVRLPVRNKDLSLINLPEQFRTGAVTAGAEVNFYSNLIGQQQWQGRLIRTEGAIDDSSQQLYVVGQIKNPYEPNVNNGHTIKIGQYVTAVIEGKTVENAIVIPNSSIYQGSYVYVVENGVLKRRDIDIKWHNSANSMIEKGLQTNDRLVLTPLGQVSSGTKVTLLNEAPETEHNRSPVTGQPSSHTNVPGDKS